MPYKYNPHTRKQDYYEKGTGEKGDKGDIGVKGNTGDTGPQGATGAVSHARNFLLMGS